ncbi:MAG: AbrB/MazE/SpoVT family DNA-binding domain-containing protein [Candidatus Contendobacter sp.]|nr:AbrB/MazE/SpoVT family DNA-binding domain-containing protein [Candidatus Contendobacter sp.]
MRMTHEGQVTIPPEIRQLAGLEPGAEIEFHVENGRVWLAKIEEDPEAKRARIRKAIEALRGSATANQDLSTDEIMAMTRGED